MKPKIEAILCRVLLFVAVAMMCSSCEGDPDPPFEDGSFYEFYFDGINPEIYEYGHYISKISSDSISFKASHLPYSSIGTICLEIDGEEQIPSDSVRILKKPLTKYTLYNDDWGKVYYTFSDDKSITNFKINENTTDKARTFCFTLFLHTFGYLTIIQAPKETEN